MIIVEGSDSSGKTTLIEQLKQDIPQLIPMKGRGPLNNYDFWLKHSNADPEFLRWTIWDRFYFSELIYGTMVRKKVRLTVHQSEVIESLLLACQPLIIHCRLIKQRELFEARPQLFEWEAMERIDNYYSSILVKGWDSVEYRAGETPYNLIHQLVYDCLISAGKWLEFRKDCPYGRGNPNQPELMVVGERFGKNNPHKVPMERSKTGVLVHDALRANDLSMWDVWITNAIKYEGVLSTLNLHELTAEYQSIKPKHVVALGRRASGLLASLHISHSQVYHPGYFMRKGNPEQFGINFREILEDLRREEGNFELD